MGKKAVKQYFNIIALFASVGLFIFTMIGLYGGEVNPVGHNMRALTTLVMPFLIVANAIMLIYWALRRSKFILIPILSIVVSINYIGTIFQFGGSPEGVNPKLTIASYNVRGFNKDATGVIAIDVINSLKKENTDVICLQEFDNSMTGDGSKVTNKIKDMYPYQAIGHDLVILSRFPIKGQKQMPFEMSNNGAMWADIKVDQNHTIRVFNVHMETTGINRTLKKAADANEGMPNTLNMNQNLANNLFDDYTMHSYIRAGQAITIANEKRDSKNPIILCGDFNDVPYSFTYNTLKGDLTDGFRQGGHGYGATYRGAKSMFRIDYIFHSDNMESLDYYTIDKEFSDHNPVFSKITFKE